MGQKFSKKNQDKTQQNQSNGLNKIQNDGKKNADLDRGLNHDMHHSNNNNNNNNDSNNDIDYNDINNDNMKEMINDLKISNELLLKFLNRNLSINEQIPPLLLADAKGIILLSKTGRGIMVCKAGYYDDWYGPISVQLHHKGHNDDVNIINVNHNYDDHNNIDMDFLIILRHLSSLELFLKNGAIKFGMDIKMSAGAIGKEANITLNEPMVCYSIPIGIYSGYILDDKILEVNKEINQKFYGKEFNAKELLDNNNCETLKNNNNKEYNQICEALQGYIKDYCDDDKEICDKLNH